METKKKSKKWSFEGKALIVLSFILVCVISTAWVYAMELRRTVAANNAVVNVDPGALIEVERIRNLAESQIQNSKAFFLLGSRALYDKQKAEKEELAEVLAKFQKQYNLPQIPEIIKRIETVMTQHQEIFDQAMDFREKKTESKIVGQFYQSKSNPILTQVNENLNEIVKLHKAELEQTQKEAREAALDVEVRIPKGMIWFTGSVLALFVLVSLLIVRMLRERVLKLAERERLYNEAKLAVQARDEVLSAVAQDLKEPLKEMKEIANSMETSPSPEDYAEIAAQVRASVAGIEDALADITDQKSFDMNQLTLRLDQLSIDDILDEARLVMQPVAKKRDIRLQIDSVNPPVLAFFDRERVLRVLSNLIGNAIKFSPKHGKVVVKVRSDQQFVNISVVDSGPGLPEKQLTSVFDNFWQAKKTADQGAGIGLAIVKTIVEAHGGTVSASNQGGGTTFTFSLPRRRPVGAQLKRPAAPVVRRAPPQSHNENQFLN